MDNDYRELRQHVVSVYNLVSASSNAQVAMFKMIVEHMENLSPADRDTLLKNITACEHSLQKLQDTVKKLQQREQS